MNKTQSVAEMLKASRERAKLTQEELAAKLSTPRFQVSRSTIAKVEAGIIKEPSYTLVREWCAATNGIDLMNLDFTGANDGWKKLRQLESVMKNLKESMAAVHLMKRKEPAHGGFRGKIRALRGRI
ncbi:helix-turn-helix domain-containing protein [Cohnella sp. GCM10020058]|uniref:helix-turn-helix domain-containing protein n=1 Tax=Cohnella sp. GCM10020058 TaxID=3317330 RepID=UPI003634066D